MTGDSESAAGEKDGDTSLIAQIPVGWQRKVKDGAVSYTSPSGTVLRSVDEVRVYLRTDGTCKCGLECPLVPNKVFNFDPAAMVQAPGHQSGKIEEDMTKLCNHRRKVDAMAALCQSMQPSHLSSPAQATGGVVCSVDSREPSGSMVAHRDGAHCTYPQPRHNQPKSNIGFPLSSPRSVLQNGSVSLASISRHPEQGSPLKKSQTPVGSMPGYAKQQWSPHPPQRTIHNPASPNSVKPGVNTHPPDPSSSYSLSPSSSLALSGGAALPHSQGASAKSPSPLSPSRTLDTFSPHQCSRHSSTSSLSEHGAQGSVFIQGGKSLQSTIPCSSPKLPPAPASPCSRLEGILQHYKDCNTSNTSSGANSSNYQTSQAASLVHPNAGDKRNGLSTAQAPELLGLPLGQILNQQKARQKGHLNNSFPASSLLSAAAKAQLANQKTQLNAADALASLPLTGLDMEQQSKVLISTLNSSVHPTSARAQSLTALLLPHSPSPASPAVVEKNLRRTRQRRSPTVLSMLKDSHLVRNTGDLTGPPLLISPCLLPPSPLVPHLDNHRLPVAPPNASRLQDSEEDRKPGIANSLPLSSPSPSQPLSALLQFLSMQSAQSATQQSSGATAMPGNRHTNTLPSSPRPITPQTPQCDMQSTLRLLNPTPQPQPQSTVPMPEPSIQRPPSQPFPLMGDETTMNLKTTSSNAILNLSQPHTGTTPDLNSSILSMMNQMSSTFFPQFLEKGCGPKTTESCPDNSTYQINQSNHNQAVESKGPVEAMDQLDSDTRLLGGCEPDHSLSLPNASSSDLSIPSTDPAVSLAEAFPFMSQEQLLQLLSTNAGLPSLLPPFLGSLPLGVWTGSQPSAPSGAQQGQPASAILNQGSPLNILNQGELPLNLMNLLNPPGSAAPLPPVAGLEGSEKTPGLQALLMASLLLSQNPAAMLPLPALNLELPTLQQVFADGVSLEKTALLDSVLMGPGLLEALQTLAPSADGQSLLFSTSLTPPPPTFLSLNPALLAAALAQTEPLPSHALSPPPNSQGTLSSPALVSTSVSSTGQEVCDPLAEQDKNNTQTHHFLPPLLAPGVLASVRAAAADGVSLGWCSGELAALGNINGLQGLLGAGALLLPQGQSLSVPLTPNQTGLNPLTCLQLTMAPGIMGEKPEALHETSLSQEVLPSAPMSQDSLLDPLQQRESSTGSGPGLFDPYGSFMDTIYTSFLQVSERGSDSTPLSYPELQPLLQQTSAPPSLSPRRACSLHNPDLSRLGMDTAQSHSQSPARGTPKPSEDPSTPPPCKPAADDALEEAKTDGSTEVCLYSNGIGSGAQGRGHDEDEEEEGRRPQGYLSPGESFRDAAEDIRDAEQVRTADVHTGARRGRKRKQSLRRGATLEDGIDRIIEEPTKTLSRPVRGKRRRVVR
ncbi:methyl-CpG-binding domain protein 6 isoform X3 [Carassius gibelio]|uniref:methyl-CpG-binding domain protein 6 isoform X3 n=1 Tax=Carassius gibelio TaxID=101364 RepID=UPI00227871F5|nr:methyl-CpG-binding domain protein 6 isoform X3 [Carassius gibelio]